MSLPAKVEQGITELVDKRKVVLSNPVVLEKLTSIELMVASAGVELPLGKMDERELLTNLQSMFDYIGKDVGISKGLDVYSKTRAYQVLLKHYPQYTLKEVKLAFELAMTGELDEYLPKSKGQVDTNHFQSFSVEYLTKILKAYKLKRGKVWSKANKALPPAKKQITLKERQETHNSFIDSIYENFEEYIKNQNVTGLVIWHQVANELKIQNLIKEILIRPEHYEKAAMQYYMSRFISSYQKPAIKKEIEAKEYSKKTKLKALVLADKEAVLKAFKFVAKDGGDIKDYLIKRTIEEV